MNKNNIKRTIFTLIAFFGSYLLSFLIDPYATEWKGYFDRSAHEMAIEWIGSLFFCSIASEYILVVDNRFNKKMPWNVDSLKRLLLQSAVQIFGAILIMLIIPFFLDLILNNTKDLSLEMLKGFWNWVTASIWVISMIGAINTGSYLITNWKKTEMEAAEHKIRAAQNEIKAAEHKQVAAEAELHALKLQLDNHFVFNNLSVLSELILKDQNLGYEYAENFAKVYRYLLVNSKIDLISLKEELKFLDAYLFLIGNRIGEGIMFDISIDRTKLDLRIPPITLQLLIENALKHNQTSRDLPLILRVFTTSNNILVVENTLIPLINKPDSAGIGLNNIKNRFALFSNQQPEIIESKKYFTVKVPLI